MVLGAVSRQKLLVLVASLVVAAAGVVAGIARTPIYTSAATLQVGTVNPNSPGFYGFVQSASDLAIVFSRSIAAEPVLAEIHAKLGLTPSESAQRLSAEPIPQSPSFSIAATGSSARAAIELANVASQAAIAYEAGANNTNPQAEALFRRYRSAADALQRASAAVNSLRRGRAGLGGDALTQALAAQDAAQLRATAVGAAYQSALVSAGPSAGLVSLLAGAVTASSDHSSKIELYGFIGLLAGLVLGCVLAVFYEQRKHRSLPS